MILKISGLLDAEQLQAASDLLTSSRFVDGSGSAGRDAAAGKSNLEMAADEPNKRLLDNLVMGALLRHPTYLYGGLPHKILTPYYSRYETGMGYDFHLDDPIMINPSQPGDKLRSDIAITVFLNDGSEYEGGELEVRASHGVDMHKGSAGDAVMYPASSLHRVAPVTRGCRFVAVTWMQSMVPQPERREILYQLYNLMESLRAHDTTPELYDQANAAYQNLVRQWVNI